jgi:hypothetical protein
MDHKTIGDWIMYYEVPRLKSEGLGAIAIGKMGLTVNIKY